MKIGSTPLLASVRTAFVQGMDVSLIVAAGIAAAGFVLTLAFLPGRVPSKVGKAEPVKSSTADTDQVNNQPVEQSVARRES